MDEHLPLLVSCVHKQSHVSLGALVREKVPPGGVLHQAVGMVEGGPRDHHGSRDTWEGTHRLLPAWHGYTGDESQGLGSLSDAVRVREPLDVNTAGDCSDDFDHLDFDTTFTYSAYWFLI